MTVSKYSPSEIWDAWMSVVPSTREILAEALTIVETVVTMERPPLACFLAGPMLVILTAWKPDPAYMGSEASGIGFKGRVKGLGGGTWDGLASRWVGPCDRMLEAVDELKDDGWVIHECHSEADALDRMRQAKANAPRTIKIGRRKGTSSRGGKAKSDSNSIAAAQARFQARID